MTRMLPRAALAAALLTTCAFAADVAAQSAPRPRQAGDLVLRLRGIAVVPQEKASLALNGGTLPGDVEIDAAYVPELDLSYFVTRNLALELIAATAKHNVSAKGGTLGGTDLGHVWLLPPTLTAQYHPMPDNWVSPYFGVGVNYTVFYNEKIGSTAVVGGASVPNAITSIDYENRFGFAMQAGLDFKIDDAWSINVDVKKIFLETKATVRTALGTVTADVDIDPWLVGFGVGYRF